MVKNNTKMKSNKEHFMMIREHCQWQIQNSRKGSWHILNKTRLVSKHHDPPPPTKKKYFSNMARMARIYSFLYVKSKIILPVYKRNVFYLIKHPTCDKVATRKHERSQNNIWKLSTHQAVMTYRRSFPPFFFFLLTFRP